ncbi:hypothetical protein H6F43_05510 [Leptolyngbya sp. FACHB-36]|uniref:hypothetical protein n=1 Tax=Leptolyngbya sp. FACHB-36 TaxID=2692808 RepID=UPI00168091AE|nr:hypothetical protein [Leptolyngbya sp. FACHB-36]MBD2019643.1 hypothetical protein [Leptolyngbya sp. FACHB-36]
MGNFKDDRPTHPLTHGQLFSSPGCHFSYRVIGPCCRLFDREQLPWPCCRIQWRGKEPSWRRIGRRFTPDLATKAHPSYSVEILGQGLVEPLVITLYSVNLPPEVKSWWHSDKLRSNTASSTSGAADETIVDG